MATEELYLTEGEVRQLGRTVRARTPRLGGFLVDQGALDEAELERVLGELARRRRR